MTCGLHFKPSVGYPADFQERSVKMENEHNDNVFCVGIGWFSRGHYQDISRRILSSSGLTIYIIGTPVLAAEGWYSVVYRGNTIDTKHKKDKKKGGVTTANAVVVEVTFIKHEKRKNGIQ